MFQVLMLSVIFFKILHMYLAAAFTTKIFCVGSKRVSKITRKIISDLLADFASSSFPDKIKFFILEADFLLIIYHMAASRPV